MLYLTGDTHGDYRRFERKEIRHLKQGDVLVVCGDFGFVWEGGKKEEKLLQKIGKRKYHTLFVPGANENYDLLRQYPEVEYAGGRARQISGNLYQLLTGETYRLGEKTLLAFGGGEALDCDIVDRTLYEDQLPKKEELDAVLARLEGQRVDCVVSYEPPYSIAAFLDLEAKPDGYYGLYLDQVLKRLQLGQWFFGKYHLDKRVTPRFMAVYEKAVPLR